MRSPPPTAKLGTSAESAAGFFWQPSASPAPAPLPRSQTDFETLEFLGKGGCVSARNKSETDACSFGSVVKARNRLDGNLYAIKRIRLPSDPSVEVKVLREVTIFSKMAHPHIVRYHSSCVH